MTPVLRGGVWLWYVPAFRAVSASAIAAEAHSVGASGVIIHEVGAITSTLRWLAVNARALVGLDVAVAIGSMGKDPWKRHLADPCVEALRAGYRVVLDAESAWDVAGGRDSANRVVDTVLDAVSDARGRVADCAWRKPSSHPRFPIREFGRLCVTRYPQEYLDVNASSGMQADGACAAGLALSRVEYPALGSPASTVLPTVRGYARSTQDACAFALQEPHQLVYTGSRPDKANELTPEVARGLRAAAKIRAAGLATIADYQRSAGLKPDGAIGPKTLGALAL